MYAQNHKSQESGSHKDDLVERRQRYIERQIALDKGLFAAFPAEVRQIVPGQFIVVPGPKFEPATTVSRATLAETLISYRQLFTTGG